MKKSITDNFNPYWINVLKNSMMEWYNRVKLTCRLYLVHVVLVYSVDIVLEKLLVWSS